ncbi:hypothetical protein XA68_14228 [Ophiocordyceps unilateralis]|uniref:Uncharacterized protein n=1 Tax=Ophiocordyceps unilateralis TaxID=268505 RepID=A0A2A9PAU0_OPHUN|nr:hypothetical protein XA68_14228 [Ophiocordyceps unilateralis]
MSDPFAIFPSSSSSSSSHLLSIHSSRPSRSSPSHRSLVKVFLDPLLRQPSHLRTPPTLLARLIISTLRRDMGRRQRQTRKMSILAHAQGPRSNHKHDSQVAVLDGAEYRFIHVAASCPASRSASRHASLFPSRCRLFSRRPREHSKKED